MFWRPWKGPVVEVFDFKNLLGGGVFGDSLGTLRDGVLGEFTWKKKPDSSLDLSGSDGASLVVMCQSWGFGWDALKDIIHERVHDWHGFWWDASIWVHLFQHLVDVDAVRFLSPPLLLLVAGAYGFGLTGLLGSLAWNFWWHDDNSEWIPRTAWRPSFIYSYHLRSTSGRARRMKSSWLIGRDAGEP